MNFWEQIYWDNSVKAYCLVLGTIAVMLLLKKFVSKYIASLLFIAVNRIWKDLDKKSFIDLVLDPLENFLLISISVFALDKLTFPSALNFTIYGYAVNEILDKIGIGAIIISFIWLLLRGIDFIAAILGKKENLTADRSSNQLIVFFRDFFKVIIIIIGILLIIKACFNQSIGNLFTGLSIVGAALALAARESLENLIASFIIFFDKPFTTGDTVKVNAVSGTIEKIGLRSTRIRTAEKTLVTVPNKQMVDSVVDNLSMRTNRKAEIKIELSVKTTIEQTQDFIFQLKQLLKNEPSHIVSSTVFFKEMNKAGILIVVEYLTQPFNMDEFDSLKEKINLAIKQIMEKSNLNFSLTTTAMTIEQ